MQRSIGNQNIIRKKASGKAFSRLLAWGFVLLLTLSLSALPISAAETPKMLCPGGMPFGIRFMTDGVFVVGFCEVTTDGAASSPAKEAGMMENDRIVKCNGIEIQSAEAFTKIVEASEGNPIEIEAVRGTETKHFTVTPKKSDLDEKYKSGMWIRDSGAGIGTVTFVCPDTCLFAGLGHGICSGDRGDLIPMTRGTIFSVNVNSVVRGKPGTPGEIKGCFTAEKLGTLLCNTDLGMFGALTEIPEMMQKDTRCKPIPVAPKSEVEAGKATIYSTLDENGIGEYEIEISDIHTDATAGKCFSVKVTDPRLIKKSGGIVQGMSGSPIIQNGKLVGAVTHVLINDPTSGFGIFIENMLNQMDDLAG